MDKKNNVIFNKTLEEYNKQYKNRRHRLLKRTKKEVEEYDIQHKTSEFLLKNRKWALIGDTYYEIPKPPRLVWFRNLSSTTQIVTCSLLGAAVATAVIVPTVIATSSKSEKLIAGEHISVEKDTFSSDLKLNTHQKQVLLDNTKVEIDDKKITVSLKSTEEVEKLNAKIEVIKVSVEDPTTKEITNLTEGTDYNLETKDDNTVVVNVINAKVGNYIITPKYTSKGSPTHKKVESITLNKSQVGLSINTQYGTTQKLEATVLPSDAFDKSVKWESSNPNVVSVDNNGILTSVATGSTTITATTNDGGKVAQCTVKVFDYSKIITCNQSSSGGYEAKFINNAELPSDFDLIIPDVDPTTGNPITEIAEKAFGKGSAADSQISKIRNIYIPSSIKVINKNAFDSIPNVNSIIIEDNSQLEVIGESAFAYINKNSNAISITLPKSLKKICKGAFSGSSGKGINEIYFKGESCWACSSNDTVNYTKNIIVPDSTSEAACQKQTTAIRYALNDTDLETYNSIYGVSWTANFDFPVKGNISLKDLAKNAKKIIIGYYDEYKEETKNLTINAEVGLGNHKNFVKAYFDDTPDNEVFYLLSNDPNKKIALCSYNQSKDTMSFTYMENYFKEFTKLEDIDFKAINTEFVAGLYCTFASCTSLTKLDLSPFKMTVFSGNPLMSSFQNCSKLEVLDISSFDTRNCSANSIDIRYMLYGCPKLKTIYASENFEASKLNNDVFGTQSASPIFGDTVPDLQGGEGTTYDKNTHQYDKTFLRIDKKSQQLPGLFTLKQ